MTSRFLYYMLSVLCFLTGMIGMQFIRAGDKETKPTEVYVLQRITSDNGVEIWTQRFDKIGDLKAAVSKMRGGKERDWDRNIRAEDLEPYPILKDNGCQCGEDCACVDCKCEKRKTPKRAAPEFDGVFGNGG